MKGDIENVLPKKFIAAEFTYIEPFVGSGAILFWMLNNFPKIEKAVVEDSNSDLTNTDKVTHLVTIGKRKTKG